MDEIRCPMCGKMNPPELDDCQYCQARLKPLIISQPPEEGESEERERTSFSSGDEESLPDWLRDLRPQDDRLSDPEESEPEEELPSDSTGEANWLERLQDESIVDDEELTGEDSEAVPLIDEDTLLERLGEVEPYGGSEPQQEDVLSEGGEVESSWISPPESEDEEELPDWLSEIRPEDASQNRGKEEIELPGEPASYQEDEQLPDWLLEVETPETEQVPDWLPEEGIESSNAETFDSDEETKSEEGEEVEEGAEYEEVGEPSEEEVVEEPTWFERLNEDRAVSVPPFKEELEVEAQEPTVESADLPDWLVDLQADANAEEEEIEEIPEWLSQSEQKMPPEDEEPDLPDWLTPIGAQEDEAEGQLQEAPEWLGRFETEEVEKSIDDYLEEESEKIEGQEPPEWLAELEKEFSSESIEESMVPLMIDEEGIEQGIEEVEETVGYSTDEAEEKFEGDEPPEWLAELEKEFSSVSGEESIPEFVDSEGEVEEVVPETPGSIVEEGADFLESLPEWAEEVSLEEGVEVEEPELEEAELPTWLEAMRPVESVAPEIFEEGEIPEEQVETRGPLAGLSGILAAGSDFARVRKPPAYSVKLHVTENQEARVALLRDLLAAEDTQKPLPAKPIISPQYIFRLVIALALIFPIAWAVISGGTLTPLPDPSNVPAGVLDVRNQIDNQLSTNAPVLVAFDYEAGFSGELDTPAKAVISHMMDKGAFLTLVSTSPSGPILAERLIDNLNQTSTRQEIPFTNYANLGYIPGGTAGLLGLSQSPQQTVPYTLDNLVIWDSAPLNLIVSVADFSMVLVLTENSETARAWIEQVQPFLLTKGTPLIMVVSAQVEPLVQPYYLGSTKQVQGLVVGIPGGVTYDSLTGQGGLARGSWDAFSLSLLITGLILIAGAFVGAGSMLFTSSEKEEE
jgi:hypothetical protein